MIAQGAPDIPPAKSKWEIIKWWEIRRILYNAILLATLILGWLWTIFIGYLTDPNGDMDFLIAGLLFPIFMIGANLFYTLGWISEIILVKDHEKDLNYSFSTFFAGTAFSMLPILVVPILLTLDYIASAFGYNPFQ